MRCFVAVYFLSTAISLVAVDAAAADDHHSMQCHDSTASATCRKQALESKTIEGCTKMSSDTSQPFTFDSASGLLTTFSDDDCTEELSSTTYDYASVCNTPGTLINPCGDGNDFVISEGAADDHEDHDETSSLAVQRSALLAVAGFVFSFGFLV